MVEAREPDELYQQAARDYGPALERLARAYESDPEARRDLLQDIHIALWRSFSGFDGRCSLRTWIYRVAHNVASSHVAYELRRKRTPLVGLEQIENLPGADDPDRRHALPRLYELIQRLQPLDRQVILSYLEGLDAASIAEISGLSPAHVAVKIHRIKRILAERFEEGQTR